MPRIARQIPQDAVVYIIAYIHNNPVRAGVALHSDDANILRWTSHRIYTGRDQAPSRLAVTFGLRLAGFDSSAEGRRQFHQFVCAHASQEREPFFCAHTLTTGRVQTRQQLGAPVELATPRLGIDAEAEYPILTRTRNTATPYMLVNRRSMPEIYAILPAGVMYAALSPRTAFARDPDICSESVRWALLNR